MKNFRPLVIGTIAFDCIYFVSPSIRSESDTAVLSETANLNFVVNQSIIRNGGTAGNISYSLGMLGMKPLLFSAVGKDFFDKGYASILESKGVTIAVECYNDEESACCYQISDADGGQMTIWISNAYNHVDEIGINDKVKDVLDSIGIASFSTGNPKGTIQQMKELKTLKPEIMTVFDPGARITSYSRVKLQEGVENTDILVLNENEIFKVEMMGFSVVKLLEEYVKAVIITRGSGGSIVRTRDRSFKIGTAKATEVVETTGAGDAYRAGLIAGMIEGKEIQEAARLGAAMASYCVEGAGGQSHEITRENLEERLSQVTIGERGE